MFACGEYKESVKSREQRVDSIAERSRVMKRAGEKRIVTYPASKHVSRNCS